MPHIIKNWGLFWGGRNLACVSNEVSLNYEVEEKDVTSLCTDTMLAFPGNMRVGCEVNGFMDLGTSGSVEQDITDGVGNETSAPFTLARFKGLTENARAYTFRAHQMKGNYLEGAVGDVHPFALNMPLGANELVGGYVLKTAAAESGATGSGTGLQIGAVSATQAVYGAIHILGVTGGPSAVDVIVESDDNSGFTTATTRLSFSSFTAAGSEWKSAAGAITDDYWRVSWTITGGTTPTFTALVVVGIAKL